MAKSDKSAEQQLKLSIPVTDPETGPSGPTSPKTGSRKGASAVMIELDLNTLFKFIKPFDGSRESVNSFIINCNNAYDLATEVQKPILFRYIFSQLQGKAEIACSIKEFKKWEQLKEFLQNQFCERKHYAHILMDLQESKQGPNENVMQYSLRVETYLSQLLTDVTLSHCPLKEIPGRSAAMEDLALHHFLIGLHPRISNIVRCRSPRNLNEAINIAISEERIQQTLYKRPQLEPRASNSNNQNNFRARPSQPRSYVQPNTSRFQPSYQPKFNSPSGNFNNNSDKTPSAFCRYCKTPGHDIRDCAKREYNNNRFNNKFRQQPNRMNFVAEDNDDENNATDDSSQSNDNNLN